MNVDDYVSMLMKHLPKYKKIKVPLSEEDAKKIEVILLAKGVHTKYTDGYFVYQESGNAEAPPPKDENTQTTHEKANEKAQETLVAKGEMVRVCIRINESIINALHTVYSDPNTSSVIRKALNEILTLKGYKIIDDAILDVNDIIGENK